jgi:hypothetical protein
MAHPTTAKRGKRNMPPSPRSTLKGTPKRTPGRALGRRKQGGLDVGKFAGEVSSNFGKGVAEAGRAIGGSLDKAGPSRGASSQIGGSVRTGASSNAYLRKALGGK